MALTKTALFALAMLFFSVSALGYCMFRQSEDLKRYVLVLTKKVVSLQEQIKEYQAKAAIKAPIKKESKPRAAESTEEAPVDEVTAIDEECPCDT